MLYVKVDGIKAFRKTIEGLIKVERLSMSAFLWSRSLLSMNLLSAFNSSTTSRFLLSAYLLLMCLSSLGQPCIVDKSEAHKIESLVVDLHIYRSRFAFSLINGQNVEVLEDMSEKETIRKRISPIFYSIDHLMKNNEL
ncbi:hypothetical protein PanWU01x14_102250 [Parasponia andersonii]|uniref:Uncharacterized protein n=1 Tax=Parasponia andersonii TaxID=3476 RepID=A0A2P5D2T8_PARAD|nr:hypothetical protein PanWU01x14_102250 [Parasponia andersonii]